MDTNIWGRWGKGKTELQSNSPPVPPPPTPSSCDNTVAVLLDLKTKIGRNSHTTDTIIALCLPRLHLCQSQKEQVVPTESFLLQLWRCFLQCWHLFLSTRAQHWDDQLISQSLLRKPSEGTNSILESNATVRFLGDFRNFLAMLLLEILLFDLEITDLPARAGLWLNSAEWCGETVKTWETEMETESR